MKINPILFLFLMITYQLQAQEILVFEGGKERHKTYQIPATIQLPSGDLLAFAEGHVNGSDEYRDVNLNIGTANGKTVWYIPTHLIPNTETISLSK